MVVVFAQGFLRYAPFGAGGDFVLAVHGEFRERHGVSLEFAHD